jgi:hypothetical protein
MQSRLLQAALLALGLAFPALAGTLPPDTTRSSSTATSGRCRRLRGLHAARAAERRAEVRGSRDRVASITDNIFLARSLAAKARALGSTRTSTSSAA